LVIETSNTLSFKIYGLICISNHSSRQTLFCSLRFKVLSCALATGDFWHVKTDQNDRNAQVNMKLSLYLSTLLGCGSTSSHVLYLRYIC